MTKYMKIIICVVMATLVFTSCSKSTKSSKKQKQDDVKALTQVSNHMTELWNEVICEASWYAGNGTGATGQALDIDFVILNMDKYYNKVKDDKVIIDNLGEEYSDIKTAFYKAFDKATIICDHLREETPKPNEKLSYKDEIDLYKQYSDYFHKAVDDLKTTK